MKICDKQFNGGIDIIVSQYYDASQKDISSEVKCYLRDHKLAINIFGDNKCSRCFMSVESFFNGIKSDILNGTKDKFYFLINHYSGPRTIISELEEYLVNNTDLMKDITENHIQVFIVVGTDENISYKDFKDFPYHFFYMTEAEDIFGKVLLDVEDKEVWKGWK